MANDKYEEGLQKALRLIREQQQKLAEYERKSVEPIAVIGMSCRLPGGAHTPQQLWQLLENAFDASIEVPANRWNIEEFYNAQPGVPGKMNTRNSCFLTTPIDEFDAPFFGISAREAEYLDPQQRLLLEVTWEAIEAAGFNPDSLRNSNTGVFMGVCGHDYDSLLARYNPNEGFNAYCATGNAGSTATGRLSYTLGLHGPNVAIDTACSSSLVALHLACQSLRTRESDMVLTGGVNLLLYPQLTVSFSKAHMLAPDGHCKTFDKSADGYVRGEGCGVLVLKRLSAAQQDADNILAIIRSSAVNQDGASGGLTAPNGPAQEAVIKKALAQAALVPHDISYIEAHGTGTALGDPIEMNAINTIFSGRPSDQPLIIGTVKTNIGHLETTAGVAGVIKTVLALQHEKIPKHLHFQELNPNMRPISEIPAHIPQELLEWKRGAKVRRAGISSFGFSGTNAHVILEEAPTVSILERDLIPSTHLLLISAKTPVALAQQIEVYQNYLRNTQEPIADICFTSQFGRGHYNYRVALTGCDRIELLEKLSLSQSAQINVDNEMKDMDFFDTLPKQWKEESNWFFQSEEGEWQLCLNPKDASYAAALDCLATLYLRGYPLDWKYLSASYRVQVRKVPLPTYAFQRNRYWVSELELWQRHRVGMDTCALHPLLGTQIATTAVHSLVLFQNTLSILNSPYLMQHKILGYVIFPATGYVELMLAALKYLNKTTALPIAINKISIESPLSLQNTLSTLVQVVLEPSASGEQQISIYSKNMSDENVEAMSWRLHAQGESLVLENAHIATESLTELHERCNQSVNIPDFYKKMAAQGLEYGEDFQVIQELQLGHQEALASLQVRGTIEKNYLAYPALLDGCLQVLAALKMQEGDDALYLPIGFERIQYLQEFSSRLFVHVELLPSASAEILAANLHILNEQGQVLMRIEEFKSKKATRSALLKSLNSQLKVRSWCYLSRWEEQAIQENANLLQKKNGTQWWLISENATLMQTLTNALEINSDSYRVSNNIQEVLLLLSQNSEKNPINIVYNVPITLTPIMEIEVAFPLLTLFQYLLNSQLEMRLFIVTQKAYALEEQENIDINHGILNGLIKTAILEHPEWHITQIDIDADTVLPQALVNDFGDNTDEQLVAYRNSKRYIVRLVSLKSYCHVQHELELPEEGYQLVKGSSGLLTDLQLQTQAEILQPKEDEVVIAVKAVGLNFRDVLNVMNLYPGDPGPLGGDCAGVITAVGKQVTTFRVGDEILGTAPGSLASEVITQAALVTNKPDALSFNAAAALPTIFLTAYYSLVELAKMQPGEYVLIHAATGGVGLAAIQVARFLQAKIIASAGSERKRAYLRELGVEHIVDSRSLSFGAAIKEMTAGHGVNVVLNSLSGPGFIAASVECCALQAQFIEIGKRDIWSAQQMSAVRADIVYHTVALDQMMAQHPARVQSLLQRVMELFKLGMFTPIPVTTFPLRQAIKAFKYLQQAQQVGKVVIELPPAELSFNARASYLITGGLGGIGLALANFISKNGAKRIILSARSTPNAHALELIKTIESQGTEIQVCLGDISDGVYVKDLLTISTTSQQPLKGIFHAAGVIDDAPLDKQTPERFANVFKAKAKGAWYLHQFTQEQNIILDYFVLFSSIASLNGSPGQSNYATANSALDALAIYRKTQDLVATAINWGPWAQVGMAKDLVTVHGRQGIVALTPEQALQALAYILRQGNPQVEILQAHWEVMAHHLVTLPSWLRALINTVTQSSGLIQQLEQTAPAKREALLRQMIMQEVRKTLSLDANQVINEYCGFLEMGMDSLMALELKDRLQVLLNMQFSNTLIFDYPDIDSLAHYFMQKLGLVETLVEAPAQNNKTTMDAMNKDEVLAEINTLLQAKGKKNE